MPVVRIEYEKSVSEEEIRALAEHMCPVAAEASERPLEEQSVYARPNYISVGAALIELYVDSGPLAIPGGDKEKMLAVFEKGIKEFREKTGFSTPITVSIIEMNWKVKVGI
ncbi:MAG: hypothetical protein ABA06_02880 [Parcubacteria bacterium C7867-001]|nr:MAG: hypothetical protein ABA06_02880 [Parcubacteria bacterium C7867-001]